LLFRQKKKKSMAAADLVVDPTATLTALCQGVQAAQPMGRLEYLCKSIGCRLGGSAALEDAVDWAVAAMTADGLENVRAEHVMTPVRA
jgi:hypothetical protein